MFQMFLVLFLILPLTIILILVFILVLLTVTLSSLYLARPAAASLCFPILEPLHIHRVAYAYTYP